ncbi:restriction endonuclease subunit S [bacterium]|nr:restriction endonuclease subunit S [bacterium]
MSFPRYPAYKATGMDWLGEVPDHWTVNRLKLAVDSSTNGVWGDEAKSDENDVICIRVADFDRQSLAASKPDEPTIRNVSDRDIEQRSLRNGDLLIEKSGGGEKQPVGAVVLYTGVAPAVCSNFVARMRLKRDQIPSFWKYVHHAAYSVRLNTKSIKQTSGIQNLDQQQYLNEIAVYPPLEEQLSIANFLDHETGKIDDLIAEQERLIDLLQEKRQAVISHAVTKGLNPNAPMMDSGVEWLGEVPAHWEVKRIKHLSQLISKGTTPSTIGSELTDEGVRFIKAENITAKGVAGHPEFFISEETNQSLLRSQLHGDEVLVVIAGATTGKSAVISKEACPANTNQAVSFIRTNNILVSEFINFWLAQKQVQMHISIGSVQSAQPNLSMEDLGNIPIAVPLDSEIEDIVNYCHSFHRTFERLIDSSASSINLFKERRSALISAAVTGQIDVRGLVPEEEVAA